MNWPRLASEAKSLNPDFAYNLEAALIGQHPTIVKLRQLIERVARTIRALHQRRLSHRDLKAANVLVRRWDAPTTEPSAYSQDIQNLLYMPESSVWLIDLVGVDVFMDSSGGARVFNGDANNTAGPLTLLAGSYTLILVGTQTASSPYAFQLLNVNAALNLHVSTLEF